MIIDNKGYNIQEEYKVKSNKNKKLKIKLKGIDKVINMSSIFFRCSSLSSFPDFSKWNTNKVTNMSCMFCGFCHYYLCLIFQNGIQIKLLI